MNYNESNEITNFREICMGSMKSGILYRGSYPIFKIDKERDQLYDKLVCEAGIKCVINLSGSSKDLEIIANLVPWYDKLLRNNNVIGLDIQFEFDFMNKLEYEIFNYKLRQGIIFIISHKGPYLIHCNAGIDRAGFVAAIIALLFGASIDEVIYDYLLSHGKQFADAKDTELNYLTGQNIYGQINAIVYGNINDKRCLQSNIEKYFIEDIGLTRDQLQTLKSIMAK